MSLTHAEFSARGGHARAKKLSKAKLKAIGKKAITARWAKSRKKANKPAA